MMQMWRLLDTGLQSGQANIALSRAVLEARNADEIPSTMRFGRSTPCVLLGRVDRVEQHVDVPLCAHEAIPIHRRFTDGPTIYVAQHQLLWNLVLHPRDVGTSEVRLLAKRICHAVATALSALGHEAGARGARDIEVDGRALGSLACAVDGLAMFFEGTINLRRRQGAEAALRFGESDLGKAAAQAAEARNIDLESVLAGPVHADRVKHNLMEAFESEFSVEFREGELTLTEEARCKAALRIVNDRTSNDTLGAPLSDVQVAVASGDAGAMRLSVIVLIDLTRQVVRHVWFVTDDQSLPSRTLLGLEGGLRDTLLTRLEQRVQSFFASRSRDESMPSAKHLTSVIRSAIDQLLPVRNR